VLVLFLATDWATISSFVTGVGTLVLAIATFAAVRSSNRSARIAEAALQEQRRPVLAPSRLDDPVQKRMFVEGRWLRTAGGRAAVEQVDGSVFLGISVRNVGSGIGVCQGWAVRPGSPQDVPSSHAPEDEFHRQSIDLYIPAGDVGMWQGALRNPDDPVRGATAEAIDAAQPIMVELLYTDLVGGQRTITRFGLISAGDAWLANVIRHWCLEWDGPRSEADVQAARDAVRHDREAAERRAAAPNDLASAPETDRSALAPDG
jgi:hypothetical protein